jgi:hypothetical protein
MARAGASRGGKTPGADKKWLVKSFSTEQKKTGAGR